MTVLCAEYDPTRPHAHVTWRAYEGLPVVELVNNWVTRSFDDTYSSPVLGRQLTGILQTVRPDVVHVHNLLNLSFELPKAAHALGSAVAATLHDYTLVCPSGGQRIHYAEQHVCNEIDVERCARCFQQSPFYAQMSYGSVATRVGLPRPVLQAARTVLRRFPGAAKGLARAAAWAPVTTADIERRLEAARGVFSEIDLFVAPSQFLVNEYIRLGVPPEKIRCSLNGLVPLPRLARHGPAVPLRIGYVGTVVWHKGIHVLIDAVTLLPSEQYELKIFGDLAASPPYAAELAALAAGLPIQLMGGFDREAVADVYAQIDVLVVPSIWMENSPTVIHEAYMAGVPVVGARMGGIPELIAHGHSGLLYDAASSSDLASALRSLIEQPERLYELRRHLPSVKPIDDDARTWESTYADLIRRRRLEAAP